jgi:hypothetical protein
MLTAAGFSHIPIKLGGAKDPALPEWEPFQTRMPTDEERAGWFGVRQDSGKKPSRGIAALMGKISGNAETIDGDDFGTLEPLRQMVEERAPGLWAKLVIDKSPRPGYRLIYRCAVIGRNQKLAWTEIAAKEDDKKAYQNDAGEWVKKHCRIETRGEGGYIVCVGSHIKTHATKRPYTFIQGTYADVQEITPEERDILFECCRSFSTIPLPEKTEADAVRKRERKPGEFLPGDDYNERGDIKKLLEKHRWEYVRDSRYGEVWRRPGKEDNGWSATLFENGNFYNFSSNADPFSESQWYTPFWCYVLLEHKGDHIAAVKQLAKDGFGKQADEEEETKAEPTVTPQEAAEIATNLPDLVKENPEAVFSPDVMGAFVLLKQNDPGMFNRARNVVRDSGAVNMRLLDEKVQERVAELKAREKEEARARFRVVTDGEKKKQTAGDFLADAPIKDLIIPNQYKLTESETIALTYEQSPSGKPIEVESTLAYGAILVTGRTQDINGEGEGIRLSWRRAGRWAHTVVDRSVICDSSALVKALPNSGFPVNTDNAKGVVRYLAAIEAANLDILPTIKTTTRLGWQGADGEYGFLVGRTLISPDGEALPARTIDDGGDWAGIPLTFRGASRGHNQIASAYKPVGTLDAWRELMDKVKQYPMALLTLYASFVPPLLRIFRCPNFSLDISGISTGGKTTAQRIAASVWGDPDERQPAAALAEWETTAVYAERASAALSGLPLILNDSKRVKKLEEVGKLIYAVETGRGKGRGARVGLDTTETWYTVLISSGEQKLTSYCEADGGTKMRVLVVTGRPFGNPSPEIDAFVKDLNLGLFDNYGTAGIEFISWLLANRDTWPEWQKTYREKDRALARAYPGEMAGRLAASAAAIYVAAKIAHTALDLPWDLDQYDPIDRLWHSMAAESDDILGCKRVLQLLLSWATAHEIEFYGRHQKIKVGDSDRYSGSSDSDYVDRVPVQGWAGKWEGDEDYEYIAFSLDRFERLMKDFGVVHPQSILEELRESGALLLDANRKTYTKRLRLKSEEGKSELTPFYAIKTEAFDPDWKPGRQ